MDQHNAFIVLFAQYIKIIYVDIISNHLKTIYRSSYKFNIKQIHSKILSDKYFLNYCNKLMKYDDFIVMRNNEEVKIIWYVYDRVFHQKYYDSNNTNNNNNDINNDKNNKYIKDTVFHIINICKSPQQLSCILYDVNQNMLICGTNQGQLKVHRINTKNIQSSSNNNNQSTIYNNVNNNNIQIQQSQLQQSNTNTNNTNTQIKLQSKNYLLFKLSLHNNKPIINIQMYTANIILTHSIDQYIQIISCQQMSIIQKYKISINVSNIYYIKYNQFIAVRLIGFDQFLYAFLLNFDYQLVFHYNSDIVQIGYGGDQGICVMALTDNSINLLQVNNNNSNNNINSNNNKNRKYSNISNNNKNIRKYSNKSNKNSNRKYSNINNNSNNNTQIISPKQSFVPPNCKSILCIQIYPYIQQANKNNNISQFWVLTDSSQVYHYRYTPQFNNININNINNTNNVLQKQTQFTILNIYNLQYFSDKYAHTTKYKIVCVKFINLVPLQFDADIKQSKHHQLTNYNYNCNYKQIKPVILGSSTGQILIVSCNQPNVIICRIRNFILAVKSICVIQLQDRKYREEYNNESNINMQSIIVTQQNNSNKSVNNNVNNNSNNNNINNNKSMINSRRLLVTSSEIQIACIVISNYKIPQTIYKIKLDFLTQFTIKQLCPYLIAIVYGNFPKLLFTSNHNMHNNSINTNNNNIISYNIYQQIQQIQQIRLWLPQQIIHQQKITTIQYNKQLSCISSDIYGKIIIWTLLSQILIIINISQSVNIQLCYSYYQYIIFAYQSKMFTINLKQQQYMYQQKYKYKQYINNINNNINNIKGRQQLINLLNNNIQWLKYHTSQLTNANDIESLLKPKYSEVVKITSNHNKINKRLLQRESQAKIARKQQGRQAQINNYIERMKGSLSKLTRQAETYEKYDESNHSFYKPNINKRTNSVIKYQSKDKNKHTSYTNLMNQSNIVYEKNERSLSIVLNRNKKEQIQREQQQLKSVRVDRVKSILTKFRQAQQKSFIQQIKAETAKNLQIEQIMLPQIKQYSKTIDTKAKNMSNKSQVKRKMKGKNFVSDFKLGNLY